MILRESICVAYLMNVEIANDEYYMKEALRQARRAFAADEVPVGAVIVREGQIIARAWNQVECSPSRKPRPPWKIGVSRTATST